MIGSSFLVSFPFIGDILEDQLYGDDTVIFAEETLLAGADLNIEAETITIQADVTVSTRNLSAAGISQGNSGNVSFIDESITLKAGSKLVA